VDEGGWPVQPECQGTALSPTRFTLKTIVNQCIKESTMAGEVTLPPEYQALLAEQQKQFLINATFETKSREISGKNAAFNAAHEAMLASIAGMKGR